MAARYLLDTNICIYIAKHSPSAVCERLARHTVDELVMSVVTLGELRFGGGAAHRTVDGGRGRTLRPDPRRFATAWRDDR